MYKMETPWLISFDIFCRDADALGEEKMCVAIFFKVLR